MPKVNRKQVEGFKAPLPPLSIQEQFAELYKQSDKSKFEIKHTLKQITVTQNALMRQQIDK